MIDRDARAQIEELAERVAALERALAGAGIHVAPASASGRPEEQRVIELLRQKRTIEAIKVYRQITGHGLKEAKDAVDRIRATHGLP